MKTGFRLVEAGWSGEIAAGVDDDPDLVWIVCPFVKTTTALRLLKARSVRPLRLITRFDLNCFDAGVSDIAALRILLNAGAAIKGIRNVHAKLYGFGAGRVIVTSANLTESAMRRNREFGLVATDRAIVAECRGYFESLWSRVDGELTVGQLADWEAILASRRMPDRLALRDRLPDFGADMGEDEFAPDQIAAYADRDHAAFVKFFGSAENRADRDMAITDEVMRSGSHWACTYPLGKRPRRVSDGDILFMGRMVRDPDDYMIYGAAVGRAHVVGLDDATDHDLQKRPWKDQWPHYVRVTQPRFLNGALSNGISLREMMNALGSDAFASTQNNAALGHGNTVPTRSLMQQPDVRLSAQGHDWIGAALDRAFSVHGHIDLTAENFDWPSG